MNWYSVGLAAMSGALAVIIASLFFGKKPEKKTLYTIVIVILFVVLNTFSKELFLPGLNAQKTESEIEAAFAEIPAFRSIKVHEPETYTKLVAILAEAKKKGHSEQQAINIGRMIAGMVAHFET